MSPSTPRFGLAKLLTWVNDYRLGFFRRRLATALIHENWHESLIESVSLQPGERILVIGPNSTRFAIVLARRFRETHLTVADSTGASVDRGRRTSIDLDLILQHTALDQPLPFATAAFDKVIAALALHELTPQVKLAFLKEARRTLRRDGTLYAAEYDKPTVPREASVFNTMRVVCGIEAARPHLDGSWITLFGRAGFKNVRNLSTHSVLFGRVALVKARKL